MHNTHSSPVPRATAAADNTDARLNRLLAANRFAAHRRAMFRSAAEEEQMLLMHRPLKPETAYALFGLLLGALPPAAIFTRLFGYGMSDSFLSKSQSGALFFLFLLMNVVCALMGYFTGMMLSRAMRDLERGSWSKMFLLTPFVGASWGVLTGAAGGFFFFGFGAIVGAIYAVPVGALAFLLFTLFHRSLERGGMIETRHFLPLASGISLMIAALILGF